MTVLCPTCSHEIVRSDANDRLDCERCGANIECQAELPTFSDIAEALDEIERKLADIGQAIKI
jgi:ribosomal protein L37AE/L43A